MTGHAIGVIVVGAGFGGLSTAISLRRIGCDVRLFELSSDLSRQGTWPDKPDLTPRLLSFCSGDVIMLGSNASRIMGRWPGMLEKVQKVSSVPDTLKICNQAGRLLVEQPLPVHFDGFPNSYANRTRVQNHLYDYALEIGVRFTFGARIKDYFEDDDVAGVIYNGERVSADIVVAADSVHSRARAYVTGKPEKAQKSGFAVYRSWFDLDRLKQHPLTKPFTESKGDEYRVWIGENIHAILTTNKNLNAATVFCTHKVRSSTLHFFLPSN